MNIKNISAQLFIATSALLPTISMSQPSSEAKSKIVESEADIVLKQLAAQKAINQQLRQRLDTLERELLSNRKSKDPLIVGLDTTAPAAKEISLSTDTTISAIEEALGEKGLVLLPAGMYRLTPSATWFHNGSGLNLVDSYAVGLSIEAGLPMGMAIAIKQPYAWVDNQYESLKGRGSTSISLSKKLNNETEDMPSFVARIGYTHNNGAPYIANGFKTYSVSLSAVKRADPLVFYGGASYSYRLSEPTTDENGLLTRLKPGGVYGLNMGLSLAATPDVSLDAGLSFSFVDKTKVDTTLIPGSHRTLGYVDLGARIRLTRKLFLSLSTSSGVTDDATDFIFSMALPYRF